MTVSEPYQLYARVRISRPAFDAFLQSAFPDPSDDEDVLAWLSQAAYYGDRYTPAMIRERISSEETVGDWIDAVTQPAEWLPTSARNDYDDTLQTWTFAVVTFSENYDDYIAAVAVFREVAKYKDFPGDDGMLIYGHLFENDGVEVALRIATGSSAFVGEEQAAPLIAEANAAMDGLIAQAAADAG
jgi:hypothetical protein